MIDLLETTNVGPAEQLSMKFGRRWTVITGDNALGKSFLLELAWWSLTRSWTATHAFALPTDREQDATIDASIRGVDGTLRQQHWAFRRDRGAFGQWVGNRGRPPKAGVVVYARADGGVSVWDPAQNYFWPSTNELDDQDAATADDVQPTDDRIRAFNFDQATLWNGGEGEVFGADGQIDRTIAPPQTEGAYRLWTLWQARESVEWKALTKAIERLWPTDGDAGTPMAARVGGPRPAFDAADKDYGTLEYVYGSVSLPHLSNGFRRVIGLAFSLVWAWTRHQREAERRGYARATSLVLLLDEPETHLHPSWQRTLLPSLEATLQELVDTADDGTRPVDVQVITTTHSPLMVASLEDVPGVSSENAVVTYLDWDAQVEDVVVRTTGFGKFGTVDDLLDSALFDRVPQTSQSLRDVRQRVRDAIERFDTLAPDELGEIAALAESSLQASDPVHVLWRAKRERLR